MDDVGKEMNKILNQKDYRSRFQEMMQEVLQDSDVQAFLEKHKDYLTKADIEKSYPKLYEFVQEKRKFAQNDPSMIAPGYEPQLTLNFHYVDVTYIPTEELLERRRQEEIKNRVQAIDIPKDIRSATIADFDQTDEREEALYEVMKFIQEYDADMKENNGKREFHKGVYLAGGFGVGKTYLLGAMANELAKRGYDSTLVHMPTFNAQIKSSIDDNTTNDKVNSIKDAEILILDDVGGESVTPWTRDEILGAILQYRMQEQLSTFFTSNMSMKDYEVHLSQTRNSVELLKAKRIMERVRYLAKEIVMSGNNRRNR